MLSARLVFSRIALHPLRLGGTSVSTFHQAAGPEALFEAMRPGLTTASMQFEWENIEFLHVVEALVEAWRLGLNAASKQSP